MLSMLKTDCVLFLQSVLVLCNFVVMRVLAGVLNSVTPPSGHPATLWKRVDGNFKLSIFSQAVFLKQVIKKGLLFSQPL